MSDKRTGSLLDDAAKDPQADHWPKADADLPPTKREAELLRRIEELKARAEAAEAEVGRLRPWALLGHAVVSDWPDLAEMDGFELEALAEEHGVLYRAPGLPRDRHGHAMGPARRKGDRIVTDTTLIERAKVALDKLKFTDYLVACDCAEKCVHDTHNAGIYQLHRMAPDLARALIREREAAERLARAVETLGIKEGLDCHLAQALDAYRKAKEETDDDQ